MHFGLKNDTVRRRAACLVAAVALVLLGLVTPAFAQAESVEVSAGSSPTQDISLSIVASGIASGSHRLYVYVGRGTSCGAFPDFNGGSTVLAGGQVLSAGAYEKTFSYTPTEVGTYTVCAYLDESEFGMPDATNNVSFAVQLPSASVTIEVSPNATQELPVTVTVSGESEVARKLYVYAGRGSTCGAFPDFNGGTTELAAGQSVSAGTYSKTFTYTPTEIGAYVVCGYIDESEASDPDAMGTQDFNVQMPYASVTVGVSPGATENTPVTVTVSGESEVARKLYVYAGRGSTCGAFPDFNGGTTELAAGQSVSAGTYSKTFTYTPTETGAYVACGYIDESEAGHPNAVGLESFTNVTPQSRAEEARRAAEKADVEAEYAKAKAAAEAREAALIKSDQEAAAKEKYEEEAPARKAAKEAAEEAQYAAEIAAAKARAHKTRVKHLSVKAAAHAGHSSTDPGYTNLDITTSPYAHVVVKLSRYGHSTEHFEWGSHSTEVAEIIRWTCKSPGGTYRYVVTAKSNVGPTLTRRGHFAPVSVTTCHQYEQREAEARARHEREVLAGYEQEEREERERRERYENNCRKLGGEPVTLPVGGEYRIYCKAPGGGTLTVPY